MNKEQGNHFKMFLNTQDCLNNQPTAWSNIPRITNYKNDLDEIISRITEKSQSAQSSVSVSGRKANLKEAIALKAASLSGVLQVYAQETGNTDLAAKVKLTKSDVDKTKEQNIDAVVKNLVSIAQENLEPLAEFGITEALLTEILSTMEEFNGLIGKPRSILNAKYVTLDSIEQLFDEGNDLLRSRLDNLMLMFKENNPEFYNGYERARTIVDM